MIRSTKDTTLLEAASELLQQARSNGNDTFSLNSNEGEVVYVITHTPTSEFKFCVERIGEDSEYYPVANVNLAQDLAKLIMEEGT